MSHCPVHELFLLIPSISRWQWHPISVAGVARDAQGKPHLLSCCCLQADARHAAPLSRSSAAHTHAAFKHAGVGSLLTLHIKQYGKWSKVSSLTFMLLRSRLAAEGKAQERSSALSLATLPLPPSNPQELLSQLKMPVPLPVRLSGEHCKPAATAAAPTRHLSPACGWHPLRSPRGPRTPRLAPLQVCSDAWWWYRGERDALAGTRPFPHYAAKASVGCSKGAVVDLRSYPASPAGHPAAHDVARHH